MAATHTITEDLFHPANPDGSPNVEKVVKGSDPSAAYLYRRAGKEVPLAEAEKYGLVKATKQAAETADKAKPAPANKAVTRTRTKATKAAKAPKG